MTREPLAEGLDVHLYIAQKSKSLAIAFEPLIEGQIYRPSHVSARTIPKTLRMSLH